jgi:hypothetical protein
MAKDYDNTGGLWKRQPKPDDKADKKYPHFTGSATINGAKVNMSAWLNKEATGGKPNINITFEKPGAFKKEANPLDDILG